MSSDALDSARFVRLIHRAEAHVKRRATGDRTDPIEEARYMAERLPGPSIVELDSNDHLISLSDARDQLIDAIRTFVLSLGI